MIPERLLKRQKELAISIEKEKEVSPEKKSGSKSEKIDETVLSEIA